MSDERVHPTPKALNSPVLQQLPHSHRVLSFNLESAKTLVFFSRVLNPNSTVCLDYQVNLKVLVTPEDAGAACEHNACAEHCTSFFARVQMEFRTTFCDGLKQSQVSFNFHTCYYSLTFHLDHNTVLRNFPFLNLHKEEILPIFLQEKNIY